jgi:hypothetical protein
MTRAKSKVQWGLRPFFPEKARVILFTASTFGGMTRAKSKVQWGLRPFFPEKARVILFTASTFGGIEGFESL